MSPSCGRAAAWLLVACLLVACLLVVALAWGCTEMADRDSRACVAVGANPAQKSLGWVECVK